MSEPKPVNKNLFWGILITILVSAGLLNGNRFEGNNLVETSLKLLLLASILTLLYMVWRRTTANAATRTEKLIQLLRIILAAILFFSLSLVISNNLRQHEGLILGLTVSSVVSALGLIILTLLRNGLTSKEPFNNSGKDS